MAIFAIVASLALLVVLVPSPSTEARYSNSQAQSQAIDCHADNSGGSPNCANMGPMTQGDATANSPINLQISGSEEQDTEDTRGIALLTVIKVCSNNPGVLPTQLLPPITPSVLCVPSDYTIHVEGNSPSPSSFQGSSVGTTVIIGEGEYSVTETKPTHTPERNIIEHLSPDCSGSISLGESKTCIITNEVRPASGNCGPLYPDICIPPPPPVLNCDDISARNFTIIGLDLHNFDGDNDGIGCEE